MANPNFSTILSTTLSNYRKQLTDNVFTDRPLSMWLMEKKRTRMLSGGVDIVEPLIYATGQSGAYSGYDQITIDPQDGLSAAKFDWKQLYATIAISGIEEAQNNGKEAFVNLLDAKIMQAEETLKEDVNRMLFGNGTLVNGKEWNGLDGLIGGLDSDGAQIGTAVVGGIDGATNPYWNSIIAGTAAAPTTLSLAAMTTPFNTSAKGNDKVDAMFTTQDLFEGYEELLLPQVRRSHAKSADSGFENLMFKGKPIFYDDECPAGEIFGINSKYLTLVGHKDRWFKNSGFTENTAANQSGGAAGGSSVVNDARYALITAYGNMTVRNRARQFRCTNFVRAAA